VVAPIQWFRMLMLAPIFVVRASAATADESAISPIVSSTEVAKRFFETSSIPQPCIAAEAPIPCMIKLRYQAPFAMQIQQLFDDTGSIMGPGNDEIMDGGYRGNITLRGVNPDQYATHCQWIAAALRSIDKFFADLDNAWTARNPGGGATARSNYRWRAITVLLVESVKRRTPSAFAAPWTMTYNVKGSLNKSTVTVRDTMFHEIFHMNDATHGDWSASALRADFDAIMKRCDIASVTARTKCLQPYAPGATKVRGGTYYAFTKNNGDPVHEYGAELAQRYFQEQQHMLTEGTLQQPAWKCLTVENARSWRALVDEFFGGRDLVPPCEP
jgi:hypothetical protein